MDYLCPGPANYYLAMVSRGREGRGGGREESRVGQVEMEQVDHIWKTSCPHPYYLLLPHLLTKAFNFSMVVTLVRSKHTDTDTHTNSDYFHL